MGGTHYRRRKSRDQKARRRHSLIARARVSPIRVSTPHLARSKSTGTQRVGKGPPCTRAGGGTSRLPALKLRSKSLSFHKSLIIRKRGEEAPSFKRFLSARDGGTEMSRCLFCRETKCQDTDARRGGGKRSREGVLHIFRTAVVRTPLFLLFLSPLLEDRNKLGTH